MLKFLKLGGSLITDKNAVEAAQPEIIKRVAREIAAALIEAPDTQLLLGHGSGSFGHVAASRYATRSGIRTREEWHGFAHVSLVAARLNGLVAGALHAEGIPVMRFQPSATALCAAGRLLSMDVSSIQRALDAGLVPLVYGDVAFDRAIGGTIISTEEIFAFLSLELQPASIWLAGDVPGVLDVRGDVIPEITPANLADIRQTLRGSGSIDVTGGMFSKVETMLNLCRERPGLSVHIFSGLEKQLIGNSVAGQSVPGTTIRAD